jgi:hypothetical protein
VLLCASGALFGCGSSSSPSDESGQAGEAGRVKAAITQAYRSPDPAACTHRMTPQFVKQDHFGLGSQQRCEQTQPRRGVKSVFIRELSVGPRTATAHVGFLGGEQDLWNVQLALIKDRGEWKLDRMTQARVPFEIEIATLAHQVPALSPDLSNADLDCVTAKLRAVGQAGIDRWVVSGDPTLYVNAISDCVGKKVVGHAVRNAFSGKGLGAGMVHCIVASYERQLSRRRTRAIVGAEIRGTGFPPWMLDTVRAAIRACNSAQGGASS